MKDHDYQRIMRERAQRNDRKHDIGKISADEGSIPHNIAARNEDQHSTQVSEVTTGHTIMGGRNEQASLRSRGGRGCGSRS